MEIERLNVSTADRTPITLGLNLSKRAGLLHANLFALRENEGPKISDHLLTVSDYVCNEVLRGGNKDEINWTLTSGPRTTAIDFSTLNRKPLKIDVSDEHTLSFERCAQTYEYDRYRDNYLGQPPRDITRGAGGGRVQEPFLPQSSPSHAPILPRGTEYFIASQATLVLRVPKADTSSFWQTRQKR